jgi:Trp operon repressor
MVSDNLINMLDGTMTSRQIALELGLNIHTFHKYRGLAALLAKPGQTLLTLEEKIYKEKHEKELF